MAEFVRLPFSISAFASAGAGGLTSLIIKRQVREGISNVTSSATYYFYGVDYYTGGCALSVIDPMVGRLVGVRSLSGGKPGRLVAHPDGSRLYIPAGVSKDTFEVLVIDTKSLDVTTRIELPGSVSEWGATLAISPDGSRLYAGTPTGAAIEIDTATNTVLRTIEDATDDIGHLAVSADGLRLYGGLTRGRTVAAVRPTVLAEGKAGEAVGFGRESDYAGGGVSGVEIMPGPDTTRLLVFQYYEGIIALDPVTLAVKARYQYTAGGDTTHVVLSPDGRHLYLGIVGEEGRILDAVTLTETGTFPAESGHGMCMGTDGTLFVAANYDQEGQQGVLLRPGTDPKDRRQFDLPDRLSVVVQAAPTAWRP
ncbi:YncE family protein [Kitasatospora sp. NPDC059327]|uniref:YncE family protein n=1 Tax=Kitasatospora sp. NPDC059327 TaxID=3346803 RepID=UPI0036CAEDC6